MAIELRADEETARLLLDPTTSDNDKNALYAELPLRSAQTLAEKYHALMSFYQAIRTGGYFISRRATPRFVPHLLHQVPYYHRVHTVEKGKYAGYEQSFYFIAPPDSIRALVVFDEIPELQVYKKRHDRRLITSDDDLTV